jgi:hypothetical protein
MKRAMALVDGMMLINVYYDFKWLVHFSSRYWDGYDSQSPSHLDLKNSDQVALGRVHPSVTYNVYYIE